MIQHLHPSVRRLQLNIWNWNPRYTHADRPAAALAGVQIGRHIGEGDGAEWVPLPAGETAYQSGWIDVPPAFRGQEIVVQYGWNGRHVARCLGTGWTDGAHDPYPPMFVWLEVEVPSRIPVVAVFGSSTAAGVGASRPLIDSWLGQWAREHGALPAFGAHSGDKALSWTSAADRKWDLYGTNIAAPDVMLYAMGSNDWAEGVDVATLQERVEANVIEIRERFTSTVYGTTITPRRRPASNDSTRLEFNESLSSSGLFHEVFDLAAAVALPDGTLDPAVDADGVHVNSLGHARLAAAVPVSIIKPGIRRRRP
ncbi:MAG: SGNH/GDSL hydrolase family protein [Brachybacterium sp.]